MCIYIYIYPVARGKIPPPCLIGVEEAGIGMARMAGEQATHWFWEAQWPRNVVWEFEWLRKVVLGIQGARFDNSSGLEQSFSAFQSHGKLVLGSPESQKRGFGNSSGSGRQAEAGRQAGRGKHKGRQGGR